MAIKAETSFSLKDQLFNREKVAQLAASVSQAYAKFDEDEFVTYCLARFPELELKARIECMVDGLSLQLPKRLSDARAILLAALPPPLDPSLADDDFGEFIWVVPGEYIARFGCDAENLSESLMFLEVSTQRFSAEYAIRHFLLKFPSETLAFLQQCTQHDHYHVRRLASEGARPSLPWGLKVVLPTEALLDLLDRLHGDGTRFVIRSVANTLNDISKYEPQAVLEYLHRWQAAGVQHEAELAWLSQHSLRTLLKQGHPGAMTFLGYPANPRIELNRFDCPASVAVGDALLVEVDFVASKQQKLKLALKVGYLKANGAQSAKVFALKDVDVTKGQALSMQKKISFKPMTTRVLYPGRHSVNLVVNGKDYQACDFELVG